jgi:hypothetical protein
MNTDFFSASFTHAVAAHFLAPRSDLCLSVFIRGLTAFFLNLTAARWRG